MLFAKDTRSSMLCRLTEHVEFSSFLGFSWGFTYSAVSMDVFDLACVIHIDG